MNTPQSVRRSSMKALMRSTVTGLVVFLAAISCSAQSASPTPSVVPPRDTTDMLASIVKSGKLRVGVVEVIPWAMHDKNGNLVGFEIDVARKLARDMGVTVEFHPAPIRMLIPDLLANRTDIIIGSLSIEPSRALKVNFSNPYNTEDVTLVANSKSEPQATQLSDFDKRSVVVGASKGSVAEEMIGVMLPEATVRTYDDDNILFQDLIAGRINAAAADSPRPEIVAKLFPTSVVIPSVPALGRFPAAFAIRRGDPGFVFFLNAWIASRESDHWLDQRRAYWFKSLDWESTL
jgi:polar amino acid transport system substrate-binding protein